MSRGTSPPRGSRCLRTPLTLAIAHRLTTWYLALVTRYSLLVTRSSLLAPRYSLLAPRSSLLATRSSLLATWHSHLAPGTRQPLDTLLPTAGREGAGARGSGVATRPTTAQAVHSGGRHPNPGGVGATQPLGPSLHSTHLLKKPHAVPREHRQHLLTRVVDTLA